MAADGWWWRDPAATNKSIKRAILKEMIATRVPMLRGRFGF
jgi:glutamate-1-semialdehyde 2,1-aminomutase